MADWELGRIRPVVTGIEYCHHERLYPQQNRDLKCADCGYVFRTRQRPDEPGADAPTA